MNCSEYQTVSNICLKCDNGYYLIENECLAEGTKPPSATLIANCKIYYKDSTNYLC